MIGVNFKPTSKFQRKNPADYRSKLETLKITRFDELGKKIRPIRDTWWIVTSESSSSKVYMLHIHMKLVAHKWTKAHSGTSVWNYAYGKVECECPSFIYCKTSPRHCKHSVELARQFFGEDTMQYLVLVQLSFEKNEPDEWCEDNYKVEEAMSGKTTKKKKYNTHAEKILLEQKGKWKYNRLGVGYHD